MEIQIDEFTEHDLDNLDKEVQAAEQEARSLIIQKQRLLNYYSILISKVLSL